MQDKAPTAAPRRTVWDVVKTCLLPDFRFQRDFMVESSDLVDIARCWFWEVEWLGFHFQMAGGRFQPGQERTGA